MADGFLEKRADDMAKSQARKQAARAARWKKSLKAYQAKLKETSDKNR